MEHPDALKAEQQLPSEWRVRRVIELLRESPEEPWSLTTLSNVAGLSPFHFIRVFQAATGLTPSRFLFSLRLVEAARVLMTEQRAISDVCYQVGYTSIGTFARRFARWTGGMTPGQLRELSVRVSSLSSSSLAGVFGSGLVSSNAGNVSQLAYYVAFRSDSSGPPSTCRLYSSEHDSDPTWPGAGYRMMHAAIIDLPVSFVDFVSLSGAQRRANLSLPRRDTLSTRDLKFHSARITDPPLLVSLPLLLAGGNYDRLWSQGTSKAAGTRGSR